MSSPPLSLTDAEIEALPAEEVLGWAYEEFGERLCLTCSWQKQSSVLVHMVSELALDDRHRRAGHAPLLPGELRDARAPRRALRPQADPPRDHHDRRAAQARGPEPLGVEPRPLLPHPQGRAAHRRPRAVRGLGLGHPARAVAVPRGGAEGRALRALRRLEGAAARGLDREGRLGVHPANDIPYNPLHDAGYRSIGCIPCTRPTRPDEEERAGRWAGSDKLECGIHVEQKDTRRHG